MKLYDLLCNPPDWISGAFYGAIQSISLHKVIISVAGMDNIRLYPITFWEPVYSGVPIHGIFQPLSKGGIDADGLAKTFLGWVQHDTPAFVPMYYGNQEEIMDG